MAVHNSAAEAVDSIDEILIQILLRLPVKSLMRFKLVCKRWNSLIISRHFSLLHNPGGHNPVLGLFYPGRRSPKFQYIHLHGNNQTRVPFAELGFPWQDNSFWIHQSCNGLFLCCSSGYLDMDNANRRSPIRSIYIYNPTTNCFTKLPRPGIVKEVPRIVVGVNLAFDHNKFPIYKVVCVRGSEFAPDLNQIEIYSAETGEWRLSGEPFSSSASFNYGVYWNGSIHWISYKSKELLFFHVDEERFEKMPLPDVRMPNIDYLHRHEVKSIGYFGECCDHLHIIKTHNTEIAFDLYEMKRDYSEWFVKYRVDLTAVSAAFPDMVSTNSFINRNFYNFSAFSLVRDEVESSFLVLKISRKGIRLDLDSNSFEEIYDFEDAVIVSSSSRRGSEYMLPCAFEYIESLAYV